MMRRVKIETGIDFSFLPPFHASLNAITAMVLAYASVSNQTEEYSEAHRKAIYVAMGLSVLFLLSYVIYHFTTPETLYCGEGSIRYTFISSF